jgi:hypothetical protein
VTPDVRSPSVSELGQGLPADDPLAALAALPAVEAAVLEARAAVDRLLTHRVLRSRSAEVTAECSLRGARATASLEGVDWPLDLVRSTGGNTAQPGANVVAGAVRTVTGLGSLLTVWERAPLQALARIHVLAAAGVLPPHLLGRPRSRPSRDEGSAASTLGAHLAPDPGLGPPPTEDEVSLRLEALAGLVAGGTRVSGLVLAAVVHGELLALRPFAWGNGIVARAAERLVLITRGIDPRAVSAPEVGHAEQAGAYGAAAHAYVSGGRNGLSTWTAHCMTAVALGAREGLAVCEGIRRR